MTKMLRLDKGNTGIFYAETPFALLETDTLSFVVKFRAGDSPLFTKTTPVGSGINVTDLGTETGKGKATIEVAPADTDAVTETSIYLWELQVNTAAGRKIDIDEGTMLIKVDVQ